jgi:hypothetical protein
MCLLQNCLGNVKPQKTTQQHSWSKIPPCLALGLSGAALRVSRGAQQTNEGSLVMQQLKTRRVFELGQILATPGALAALQKAGQEPHDFLARHVACDWGDLSDEDQNENDYSLENGFRLLSSYRTNAGDKLWIITEADRSATTLLLPEEY